MNLRLIEQACCCSTDGASRRPIHGAVLVSAAGTSGGECIPPRTCTCKWFAFATEAAMNLRLIEQACGCSTVRVGGRLTVPCSSLPLALWRQSACR